MSKKRYGNELHPLYSRWLSMTQRCNNPKSVSYKNYGARGIIIDPAFVQFKGYCQYVESLPNYGELRSLDRIDNMKGYIVGNLRWASCSVQTANQRFSGKGFNKYTGVNWSKTHNRWIARVTFKGKTILSKRCLTELEAMTARNTFIKENNLPHTIQSY